MTDPRNNVLTNFQPNHLAIIMDGSGRWATRQNLPRFLGHKKGLENLRTIIEEVMERKIPFLTVWAFSTENWSRPAEEVHYLINLFISTLEKDINELHEKGIKLNIIGLRDKLSAKLCQVIDDATVMTQDNDKLTLTVAFNYGGRADLTQAVQKIAQQVSNGALSAQDIDEKLIQKNLLTKDLPDPDFVIRTGDVQRLSNFMMWQCGYAELFFSPILWPDFTKNDLIQSLLYFEKVERRFGSIK